MLKVYFMKYIMIRENSTYHPHKEAARKIGDDDVVMPPEHRTLILSMWAFPLLSHQVGRNPHPLLP
ncbi:MAG: hypothetical protein U5L72_12705 [Bacteroidales bacterium]|nr:hypothetical protein [Bacteroidales bacterium]